MIAHMLNIAVGLTFSGGLLDLFIFGILQGNEKTSWMLIIPVGIVYFFLYYGIFTFLIRKFDLKTPGREENDEETRLYSKADVHAKRNGGGSHMAENTAGKETAGGNGINEMIERGLGGKKNIADVDCCATRLRCSVKKPELVDEKLLKRTGASGVIKKGQGVQIIYGPSVTVIKSDFEEYLKTAEEREYDPRKNSETTQFQTGQNPETETAEAKHGADLETTEEGQAASRPLFSPFKGRRHPLQRLRILPLPEK